MGQPNARSTELPPSPRRPGGPDETRRPVLFWAIIASLLGVFVWGGIRVADAVRGGGGDDIEARLARIEERLEALDRRGASPRFLVDPSQPAERATVSEAVAALAKEVEALRGQGRGDDSASPHELASSEDAGARRRVARRLRDLAKTDPEARKLLSKLLTDADPRVRREAVESIQRVGDPAAIGELTAILADKEPGVRAQAANALGDLAEKSKDPTERTRAAQALEGILADERPGVRREAVEALGEVGGREALSGLMRALGDKNFEVQEQAVEGLARTGDPAAATALRQTYGDGSGPNALEAAIALKKLGDPSAFQKEAERLRVVVQQPGGSPQEKREALQLLVENNPQEGRALLERALRDPSEAVRRDAQRMLERAPR